MSILIWIVIGLLAGLVARFLVPGRDPMGLVATVVLGMAGSLVGGFLGNLLFGGQAQITTSGLFGSVIGAIILLLIYRMAFGRRN